MNRSIPLYRWRFRSAAESRCGASRRDATGSTPYGCGPSRIVGNGPDAWSVAAACTRMWSVVASLPCGSSSSDA